MAAALTVTIALVTGAASCSGDDPAPVAVGPTATTPTLTKEAFVKQANEVCAAADKQITAIASTAPVANNDAAQTQAALKAIVDQITPIAQGAIDTLKNLTPPPEQAATIAAGIAQMQSTLAAAQADPSDKLNPIGLPNRSLNSYGLTSCFTTES